MRRFGSFFAAILSAPAVLLSLLLVGLVRLYQIFISPLLGNNCRFTPTCSQYFILAVKKYGPIRGAWKGTLRLLRCHPFHEGGEDWP